MVARKAPAKRPAKAAAPEPESQAEPEAAKPAPPESLGYVGSTPDETPDEDYTIAGVLRRDA